MDGLAAAAAVLSIPTDNNAEKEMGQGSTPGTLGDDDPQASSIEAMDIDKENNSGDAARRNPEDAHPKV